MLGQLASETAETMQLMRTCIHVPGMTPDDSLFSAATKLHASWQQNAEKKSLQERQLETLDTSMEFLRSQLAKANSTLEQLLDERDSLRRVSREHRNKRAEEVLRRMWHRSKSQLAVKTLAALKSHRNAAVNIRAGKRMLQVRQSVADDKQRDLQTAANDRASKIQKSLEASRQQGRSLTTQLCSLQTDKNDLIVESEKEMRKVLATHAEQLVEMRQHLQKEGDKWQRDRSMLTNEHKEAVQARSALEKQVHALRSSLEQCRDERDHAYLNHESDVQRLTSRLRETQKREAELRCATNHIEAELGAAVTHLTGKAGAIAADLGGGPSKEWRQQRLLEDHTNRAALSEPTNEPGRLIAAADAIFSMAEQGLKSQKVLPVRSLKKPLAPWKEARTKEAAARAKALSQDAKLKARMIEDLRDPDQIAAEVWALESLKRRTQVREPVVEGTAEQMPKVQTKAVFNSMDLNGDGVVDAQEFDTAVSGGLVALPDPRTDAAK